MLCSRLSHSLKLHNNCPEAAFFCHCSGILVTGTVVLEALAQCGTAAFDKTGTLTTGQLAATSMRRPDAAAAANGAAPQHSYNGAQCSPSVMCLCACRQSLRPTLTQTLQCKALEA